jgi:predicted HD phosphohydrolase
MTTMADRLIEAMTRSAAHQYGQERVDELAHALQCAELAEAAGADEELVLACLLHDVGRYAVDQDTVSDSLAAAAVSPDARRGHHEAGADLIAPHVPARVAFLVRFHTEAKRFLCTTEPGYHATLSPGSKHTLTLQGGLMTRAEVAQAQERPWWPEAIALRRWDDAAKVVGRPTRSLEAWKPLLMKYFGGPPVLR